MPIPTLQNSATRRPRRLAWSLPLAGLLPLALACGGEQLKPAPVAEPADLYWDLNLNHHAVVLSTTPPYDTLTLTATPRNYLTEPLAGAPVPRYRSESPDLVQVTPGGTLVAVKPPGAQVYASVTIGNITHEDSVVVSVTDDPDPPVLTTFSIHPVPPDSAKVAAVIPPASSNFGIAVGPWYTVRANARDADGNTIDIPFSLRVADTTVAERTAGTTQIYGRRVGSTTLYADVTAYGISKADTLPFTVGFPLVNVVTIEPVEQGSLVNRLVPTEVKIGAGGAVLFAMLSPTVTTETDITFTDPTNVGPLMPAAASYWRQSFIFCAAFIPDCTAEGNLVLPPRSAVSPWSLDGRTFRAPGTYEFHSTAGGYRGRVVVVDEH